jgi:hypothetical protein
MSAPRNGCTQPALASCGEGFIDIFRFAAPAGLARTHRRASAAGARTAFFSTQIRTFHLAVPHRDAQGAEIRIYTLPAGQ